MTTTLLVARHGNTFAPGETPRRVGRRTNLPLVASGLEQGRALGRYLGAGDLVPSVVFCARLARARQTADCVVEALGIAIDVLEEDRFDEIDYGPDEGQPEAAVVARVGEAALRAWDEAGVPPPGWEVSPGALARTWRVFADDLVERHRDRTVLVVTSNGVARFAPVITGDYEAFSARHAIKLSTGAVSCFDHDGSSWSARFWNVRP